MLDAEDRNEVSKKVDIQERFTRVLKGPDIYLLASMNLAAIQWHQR